MLVVVVLLSCHCLVGVCLFCLSSGIYVKCYFRRHSSVLFGVVIDVVMMLMMVVMVVCSSGDMSVIFS